ncbi:hypothetical protein AMATHDRAFT_148478 [Amanita thiersii Skay4041]|uniref:SHSP domain-containing protein n=1 Tax=Amanita thiersii Skay4041 TaxID=703135 RepID=A0A2A9NLE8_9AGAR|nr:hypothetical protein AMATHDRAFT_148478 [Amanita thiersii Skay4041]
MSSVLVYEPFYDFDRLFNEAFDSYVRSRWAPMQRRSGDGTTTSASQIIKPKLDLYEDTENNIVIAAFELPGLNKDNVQIDVHEGCLTISGEIASSSDRLESGFVVRERKFGKFSRTIQLPRGVDHEQIKASMVNGVLTVTFPKTTPEMAPKKITVS